MKTVRSICASVLYLAAIILAVAAFLIEETKNEN